MVIITQDDLTKFLYGEANSEKTALIEQLIANNNINIQQRLAALQAATEKLDEIKLMSPDERSVDRIFNYSESRVEALDSM